MTPTTIERAQALARQLSAERNQIAAAMRAINAAAQAAKDAHLPQLQAGARAAAATYNELAQLIGANPALFEKPRTQIIDGVKFGLQKQKGKLVWADDDTLCAALRKAVAAGYIDEAQLHLFIKTTEKPVAAAIDKLDARLLKKIGVTVEADTDAVIIKSVDSEIEKAVSALLVEVCAADEARP